MEKTTSPKDSKYQLVICLHDTQRGMEFLERWDSITHSVMVPYDTLFVYSRDEHDEALRGKLYGRNVLYRPNIGRDYGAFYDSLQSIKKDRSITHVGFLHDDVFIVSGGWLDGVDELFGKDPAIGVVSPQCCRNCQGELIPRGSLWFASKHTLNNILWPRPTCDEDAYDQEMNLLPAQMKQLGLKLAQIGNGTNVMYPSNYFVNPETVAKETTIFDL